MAVNLASEGLRLAERNSRGNLVKAIAAKEAKAAPSTTTSKRVTPPKNKPTPSSTGSTSRPPSTGKAGRPDTKKK